MNQLNHGKWNLESTPIALGQDLERAIASVWGDDQAVILGHAYDGVIWGRLDGGRLTTSNVAAGEGAALDSNTLLDLRVFGGASGPRELRIFRNGAGLVAVLLREEEGLGFVAVLDEEYELLGAERRVPARGGFIVLEGPAGQRHAPPGVATRRVHVRHYFERDVRGLLRMAEHRYLGLF